MIILGDSKLEDVGDGVMNKTILIIDRFSNGWISTLGNILFLWIFVARVITHKHVLHRNVRIAKQSSLRNNNESYNFVRRQIIPSFRI